MNGENSKLAFNEWIPATTRSPATGVSQSNSTASTSLTCNVAHSTVQQDELLLRTKAQWEKQQAATAAAAMCYWGYTEPNPLLFAKTDWRHLNGDRIANSSAPPTISSPSIDSVATQVIQTPRSNSEPTGIQSNKISREPRLVQNTSSSNGSPNKKKTRSPSMNAATLGSCTSLTDNVGASVNKPFPCTDCGKSFRQHSQLLTHQRTHTGDRPYLCTDCPKAFRTQGTLAIHRRIHTGEKPYTCEECGRSFRTQGTLVIHRRTHSGDRPYKCQDCGKAFAARCSLVVHWRTHTGEKPYMCTECGKLFASRSDSARHSRTHQPGNNGKKPYIRRIMQQHPALQ